MLYIGAGDFDADHLTEARSHFALWAMLNAPLMIGADLRKTPQALMDIFGNADIIALDQDPAGNQAVLAYDSSDLQILVKTLASGDKAVAIFNRGLGRLSTSTCSAAHLKFSDDAPIELTDLWTQAADQLHQADQAARRAARDADLPRARHARACRAAIYLSEQPGSVNPAVDGVVAPDRRSDHLPHRRRLGRHQRRRAIGRPMPAGAARAPTARLTARRCRSPASGFAAGIGILANSRLEVRNDGARASPPWSGVDDSATRQGATP